MIVVIDQTPHTACAQRLSFTAVTLANLRCSFLICSKMVTIAAPGNCPEVPFSFLDVPVPCHAELITLIQVAETKQQAAQELQNAREQLQLHSQLLQEQDEEVQKLRKLLEVQHEQMTAQEQHHSQEMKSLQECIRDQRQHAAELQQRAVRQEAEGMFR